MSRTRTDRSPAHRMLAACALTGAALLSAVTGGQAWADGSPKSAPATPSAAPAPANGAAAAVAPAKPGSGPAATASPAQPAPKAATAEVTSAPPAPERSPGNAQPQVREVPKGAAQAGDGSAATDGNGLMLAGGGAVAAVGAAALGFAVLRRRSGARD
ncbi:hypothetical protein ACH4E7_33275 [Kitasatospora sp. NPDC018058]|uniref:hypothetical protein n=1 Tax=Kitasatospora sp. NPDC018058 TaxID=3364025 RepID=UPI0037BFBBD1